MHIPTPEELFTSYRSWMEIDSLSTVNWPAGQETSSYQQALLYARLAYVRRDVEAIQICIPPYILCDMFMLTGVSAPTHEWLSESFIEIADMLVTKISC